MKKFVVFLSFAVLVCSQCFWGCGGANQNLKRGVHSGDLRLTRAVIYQNGVGYFERRGKVNGDSLTLRIRADQVNDFLKSLTVIDSSEGKAVSVSLPLDRTAARHIMELANALKQGIGLPHLIGLLKGSDVTLVGTTGVASGRILAVDEVLDTEKGIVADWRVSVMGDDAMHTIMLSDVHTIRVDEDFVILGLHKGLDAAATGGVFKVVDVTVRLDRGGRHELLATYVVECPAWKPSYRIVVGEDEEEVLLQGWAVVDNVTGEQWEQIDLSLTSGAPLAFRYDLYAPRFVGRPDLTHVAGQKVARTAVGETSYTEEAAPEMLEDEELQYRWKDKKAEGAKRRADDVSKISTRGATAPASQLAPAPSFDADMADAFYGAGLGGAAAESTVSQPVMNMKSLQASARSMVRATAASGSVRYDLMEPVSVPDRSSTLVSILNHRVKGEEAFLFTPGGAGSGYEQNPYRVVRFKNETGFILEPGPISIYSGGTFVGEGISESISDNGQATIPFAVDASILVESSRKSASEGARLLKIVKGVMTVQRYNRVRTTYRIKGGRDVAYRVYVRHPKAGGDYKLKDEPDGTEDLGDAFLVPMDVKKRSKKTEYVVVEQTPVKTSLTIWDSSAVKALELVLKEVTDLPSRSRARLEEVLEKRSRIGEIDTRLKHLRQKQSELDQRMYQTRQNIRALEKNRSASNLKARLASKLSEYSRETDIIARQIVELTNERMELKVAMEDTLSEISLEI